MHHVDALHDKHAVRTGHKATAFHPERRRITVRLTEFVEQPLGGGRQRFQIILAGSELCNGYSELNDPVDQLARFMEQQSARDAGDDEAQMLDIDYVEMLEYGMPPASGLGVSERLFWFLEGVTAREGTLFPQMKRHISPLTKSIYSLK